ncbi:hypothetical protein [Halomicronema sp. CCY15110]|uniref:hypothetical protein n=1 Tax=Halomicronema sp. CCY15110 TaxID=2767773 RepID=UPI001950C431|nr:hypothetical protein [Halomicronema sp. CCY15110]
MVSFRNSQFQAILVGMVIADAVSQGQLPWGTRGAAARPPRAGAAIAIVQDDWCHAIAAALTAPLTSQMSEAAIATEPPTIAALLTDLPQRLSTLDQRPLPAALGDENPPLPQVTISAIFDACLQASLQQDAATLYALGQQLSPAPSGAQPQSSPAAGLSTALEALLTAQGDFQLAVGQSLQLSTPPPGSVILTAILSASWGDLPSIPMRYRHWLQQPSPPRQGWLQQRWHCSTGNQLALWSETLWQRWSGQYSGNPERSPLVAIQLPNLSSNCAFL